MSLEASHGAETAYHEASHAVVGAQLGLWPVWISIEPSEDYQGGCRFDTPVHVADPTKNTEKSILRAFAINEAGAIGQLIYLYRSGAPIDIDRISHTARADRRHRQLVVDRPHLLPGVDLAALAKRGWTLADDLLGEHWPRVERLAAALLVSKTLTGQEIADAAA